ncbi:hypothetical protein [Qipengyuania sp. ASV99]|uniref:hypothetical protein n=1 Tax=Qipengyuania sp. ASV99 TaxID=3399681 RepID=UPI003A4C805E
MLGGGPGNDLIAEYNSAGTMLDRYVHGVSGGDDPAIAYPGSNADHTVAEYLYADRLGSIVASFNRSGGLETINAYDEFGMPGSAGGTQNSGRFRYSEPRRGAGGTSRSERRYISPKSGCAGFLMPPA